MHDKTLSKIPLDYRKEIKKAVSFLKEEGCEEVYIFGSLAEGESKNNSDIDIAIKGCPKGKFFSILGKLMLELDYPIDLIDLDKNKELAKHLEKEGTLLNVS